MHEIAGVVNLHNNLYVCSRLLLHILYQLTLGPQYDCTHTPHLGRLCVCTRPQCDTTSFLLFFAHNRQMRALHEGTHSVLGVCFLDLWFRQHVPIYQCLGYWCLILSYHRRNRRSMFLHLTLRSSCRVLLIAFKHIHNQNSFVAWLNYPSFLLCSRVF